jgi:hypothetical protein
MNAATISAVVVGALMLITFIGGLLRWFYKRGRDEQSLTSSIDRLDQTGNRQAKAAEELAAQVGGLRDTLEKHSETLVEHHWRLKALEGRTVEVKVQ